AARQSRVGRRPRLLSSRNREPGSTALSGQARREMADIGQFAEPRYSPSEEGISPMQSARCTPEWPVREAAHSEQWKHALQILRERQDAGESPAFMLKAYGRPEEGLKLSTLKLFLERDHKGPVRDATRRAVVSAGRRAWA